MRLKYIAIFFKDTVIKELNDQEVQLKEIIESNEIHEDSFDFVVSMNDGLIINTSNSIQKSMGYPKYMWQGRSFIDFIHPKDHISFISYVTSVLTDPCTISRQGMFQNYLKFLKCPKLKKFKNSKIVIYYYKYYYSTFLHT